MKPKLLILASLAILVSGCGILRPRVVTVIKEQHDTTIHERIVIDSVMVEIPTIIEKVVTHDTLSHLENAYAKSDASVVDGFLHHSLETKPHTEYVPVYIPVSDTLITSGREEVKTETKFVEKELTKWQKFRMDGFWILLGLTMMFAAFAYIEWMK